MHPLELAGGVDKAIASIRKLSLDESYHVKAKDFNFLGFAIVACRGSVRVLGASRGKLI